jgi:hypothetical protein
MKYKQLYRKLNESKESFISFGKVVHYQDGKLTIDGDIISEEFGSLEEAKEYCKSLYISHKLEEDIKVETYEELEENRIAKIISEHHNIKVTDTLIESYLELASSKLFTVDPVVSDIRKLNKLDQILEGKFDYRLSDGSTIIISEVAQENLNNLLKDQKDIIEYMRESKENFLHVLELIEE